MAEWVRLEVEARKEKGMKPYVCNSKVGMCSRHQICKELRAMLRMVVLWKAISPASRRYILSRFAEEKP
jgi:hypothetical protein